MRVLTIMAATATAMLAACGDDVRPRSVAGGNAVLGKHLIEQYQCGSCHMIPDVAGSVGNAGPPLPGFGKRSYIAGSIPNLAPALVQWLVDPPAMKPGTMMPNLGVSQAEARHMSAYLYTLQ